MGCFQGKSAYCILEVNQTSASANKFSPVLTPHDNLPRWHFHPRRPSHHQSHGWNRHVSAFSPQHPQYRAPLTLSNRQWGATSKEADGNVSFLTEIPIIAKQFKWTFILCGICLTIMIVLGTGIGTVSYTHLTLPTKRIV